MADLAQAAPPSPPSAIPELQPVLEVDLHFRIGEVPLSVAMGARRISAWGSPAPKGAPESRNSAAGAKHSGGQGAPGLGEGTAAVDERTGSVRDNAFGVGPAALQLTAVFTLRAPSSVLFGPSAAGKSTLLRLLAGLLIPDRGSIRLAGTLLTNTATGLYLPPGQRGIGYLTQEPALFPHLTVAGNLAYGLHRLGGPERQARVDEMLERFALHPLAHRRPARLSGGERQRVALARALAPRPRLLLLDEPFAGLDPELRQETTRALHASLAAQVVPTALLSVSHDVAEVYASNAEVLLLSHGRITAQGPSRQVLAHEREKLLAQLNAHPEA